MSFAGAKLGDLPEDIWRSIVLKLDGRTAANLQRTARFLQNVLDDSALWHTLYARASTFSVLPPARVLATGFLDWKGAYGLRFLREQRRKDQLRGSTALTLYKLLDQERTHLNSREHTEAEACAPLCKEGWRGTIHRYDWKAFQRTRRRVVEPE